MNSALGNVSKCFSLNFTFVCEHAVNIKDFTFALIFRCCCYSLNKYWNSNEINGNGWLTKQLILYFPPVVLRYPVSNSMIEPIFLYKLIRVFQKRNRFLVWTALPSRLRHTILWKNGFQFKTHSKRHRKTNKIKKIGIFRDIDTTEFFALTR